MARDFILAWDHKPNEPSISSCDTCLCCQPYHPVFLMWHVRISAVHPGGETYLLGILGKRFFFVWDKKNCNLASGNDGCRWTGRYLHLHLSQRYVLGSLPCMRSSVDEHTPSRLPVGGILQVREVHVLKVNPRYMVWKSHKMPWIPLIVCSSLSEDLKKLVSREGPAEFD